MIMLYIAIMSICAFVLFGLVAYFNPMIDVLGISLFFSRGAALAIILLTMLVLIFVSYDFMTWLRKCSCCRKKMQDLFDHMVLYHRFCGYLILLYSVIHSIGHCTGTAPSIHRKPLEEVNSVFTHN